LNALLSADPMGERGEAAGCVHLVARAYVIARRDRRSLDGLSGIAYALRLLLMGWTHVEQELTMMAVDVINHWEEKETWTP
jgi:hypothetical protein